MRWMFSMKESRPQSLCLSVRASTDCSSSTLQLLPETEDQEISSCVTRSSMGQRPLLRKKLSQKEHFIETLLFRDHFLERPPLRETIDLKGFWSDTDILDPISVSEPIWSLNLSSHSMSSFDISEHFQSVSAFASKLHLTPRSSKTSAWWRSL